MQDQDTFRKMFEFAQRYVTTGSKVLEVGVTKKGQNYSMVFKNCTYRTIHTMKGADFYIEPNDTDEWGVKPDSFDVVIAADIINRTEFFWRTLHSMVDICKCGGIICIVCQTRDDGTHEGVYYYRFNKEIVSQWARYMSCEVHEVNFDHASGQILAVFKKPLAEP